jgi:hypothetical protein
MGLTLTHPLQPLLDRFSIAGEPIKGSSITSEARAIALECLDGLVHPDTKRFIYRVLSAMFETSSQKREGDRWNSQFLSIPREYIRKTYHRDVDLELPVLVELGVLEASPYSPNKHVCKGYRVVWGRLVYVFSQPITLSTPKVFLTLPESKAKLPPSDIARDAAKSIPTGQMELWDSTADLPTLLNELKYVFDCWFNQDKFDKSTGILTYKQTYHTTEIGGRVYSSSGDQLVCRELKSHWFDLPNCFNYDIKGCHISSFNQIHPTEFGANWMKRAVLALTYGAQPTAHSKCEIYKIFLGHFGDRGLAKAGLIRFSKVTAEYRGALKCWFDSIKKNPREYQTNAIRLKTESTQASSLASHYLQGLEQQAITWLSSQFNQIRYRYQVISNQFDGLVTIGEIPEEILAKFNQKFNLTIEIKPIY